MNLTAAGNKDRVAAKAKLRATYALISIVFVPDQKITNPLNRDSVILKSCSLFSMWFFLVPIYLLIQMGRKNSWVS